jgi:peptide/nickel transport system substrate-binding protein
MKTGFLSLSAAALCAALAAATPAGAAEAPKYGGTLVYMIPADAPPSFDAHRENTYATIHSAAPFYSVLIRVNPTNPGSPTDFVCDLCTQMPEPTDGGKTWTFKIRQGVKFHNGDALTAADVAASLNKIASPPEGVLSPRASTFSMVEKIEAPDPETVVIRLAFATSAFLPALASPYNWIYQKTVIDKDPHWYEQNILGSGPFKFARLETSQKIKGVRNPDYYHAGLPYLDGFEGIYAPKQSVQLDAIRADRAATEFRGYPPAVMNQLQSDLGDKLVLQTHDWNCASLVWFNHKKKPFDDVRVRRALTLAIDRWGSAEGLSKIAIVRTVGSIVYPGSPLAPSKDQLTQMAGYWPDIEKSRAEAKRLLKEAGAEDLSFELLNRNVDQPYMYNATWLIDQWSKIGVSVTQRVVPTGPWFAALRNPNDFSVGLAGNCNSVVNPAIDVATYLPASDNARNFGYYDDQELADTYEKMLRETDAEKQRNLMHRYAKRLMDDEAHIAFLLWWNRIVPLRSYVHGWKIGPSHYLNQDLGTVWLSEPKCGSCTDRPPEADKRAEAQSK